MFTFRPISFDDQDYFNQKLRNLNCRLMNYSFVIQYIYRNVLDFQVADFNDYIIVKTRYNQQEFFMLPVGPTPMDNALNEILHYGFAHEKCVRFFQFCNENAKIMLQWLHQIENNCSIHYENRPSRDEFEYIYESHQLATLDGHELKAKRNHCHAFEKNYSWSQEPITVDNLNEILQYSTEWDDAKIISKHSKLINENIALQEAFTHYFDLNLNGLVLRVNGKIVAFTIGYPLNDDTYLVLFEKADRNINGAYTMINKLFAQQIEQNYLYINRAEDCGVPGLRQAKLSYNPVFLNEVNHLIIYQNE